MSLFKRMAMTIATVLSIATFGVVGSATFETAADSAPPAAALSNCSKGINSGYFYTWSTCWSSSGSAVRQRAVAYCSNNSGTASVVKAYGPWRYGVGQKSNAYCPSHRPRPIGAGTQYGY